MVKFLKICTNEMSPLYRVYQECCLIVSTQLPFKLSSMKETEDWMHYRKCTSSNFYIYENAN